MFDDGDQITHSIHDASAVIYDRAPEEVYVGQHVIATWKGGVKFFIGFVTEERDDGKFKVVFDDNDEDYYNADDLRQFPDHEIPHEGKWNQILTEISGQNNLSTDSEEKPFVTRMY